MSPTYYSKQDSANASRPVKKIKQKQQQQQQQQQQHHQQQQQQQYTNSHTYNHPILVDDDEALFPPPPPPPRKDKQKKQQQHQKENNNKKKRSRDEADDAETRRVAATAASTSSSSSSVRNKVSSTPRGNAGKDAENDEDDEEADSRRAKNGDNNNDDEADDEKDSSKHTKKKLKKSSNNIATVSTSTSTTSTPNSPAVKNKTNRLVLRLPRSKGFGPSTTAPPTTIKKNTSPLRNGVRHPSSALSRTVTSSPQSSSSELSEVDLDDLPEDVLPDHLNLDSLAQHSVHFASAYESESSDGYSDLLEDDEDDLLEAEEAYLIADKLQRQGRNHSRRGTTSPGAKRSSDGAHSDADSLDGLQGGHNSHYPIDAESVLFEIAQLRDGTTTSEAEADSAREIAVTWSGAEDNDILDDLDEFLGITTDDAAALRNMQNDPSLGGLDGDEELDDENKTMRFEDFLGQDDGSDSGDSDSTEEEESSSEDEGHSVAATGTDVADGDIDDDNLETTKDVVKKGGFVFFKASHDDDETESEDDFPEDLEDDGGDTTDTLDDTDHLGMIRFGIEAAESDDEDAEEALANAIRDRNMIDAHNMGLSVSIEALAEQPEAVVLKTARSLGVSTETAAKILTSVGMSLLMRTNGHEKDVFAEPRPSSSSSRDQPITQQQAQAGTFANQAGPVASTSALPIVSNGPSTTDAEKNTSKTFVPVLGDFAPSGEADLCVVVGATDAPAPSPFSARKRKTRSSTRSLAHPSPIGRGQSVASTMSSNSAASTRRYHSSEEPQYQFVLELDDLVDPSMLPSGMSSVSEEDEDLDDAASVSTALGGTPAGTSASVGDVSRWNRIPIGAFRSQNPTEFASLAGAVLSGSGDPSDLSFHGGFTFATDGGNSRSRNNRYIPVSPVMFPVGQTFKALAAVKSRKDSSRKDKKSREGRATRRIKLENGETTSKSRSRPSSRWNSHSQNDSNNLLRLPQSHLNSLPSDGLTHHVSPLFSGVASGIAIPPLSL